jgi:hypothetical protein
MASTDSPAFRGRFTIFFDGIISMMNPYPKPWKFRVRRILKGWDGAVWQPSLATIELDASIAGASADAEQYPETSREIMAMNPAHIIYECLTNRIWGRGLDRSFLDDASFVACAQTLHAEGFGLCLKWDRQDSIEGFVQHVVDTIGAAMYEDRQTGLIKLKLIRSDYTFASLPVFDARSGLLEINEATISSPTNLLSQFIVSYKDPVTDKARKVSVHNLAALQANGGVANTQSREYLGLPTAELAGRVAMRDLRAASSRLRRFSLIFDRRAWNVYPGDVIRIRDVGRNIPDTAIRIVRYEDGTFSDGRIRVGAVQDVFALPATSFTGVQPPGWVPPNNTACVGRHAVFEMPYAVAARFLAPADFAALSGTGALFATLMEEGQTLNTAYSIYAKSGAIATNEQPINGDFYCPTYNYAP